MAAWEREFKLPWREASPPNHHDDKVDSDQQAVNEELSVPACDSSWTDTEHSLWSSYANL